MQLLSTRDRHSDCVEAYTRQVMLAGHRCHVFSTTTGLPIQLQALAEQQPSQAMCAAPNMGK